MICAPIVLHHYPNIGVVKSLFMGCSVLKHLKNKPPSIVNSGFVWDIPVCKKKQASSIKSFHRVDMSRFFFLK